MIIMIEQKSSDREVIELHLIQYTASCSGAQLVCERLLLYKGVKNFVAQQNAQRRGLWLVLALLNQSGARGSFSRGQRPRLQRSQPCLHNRRRAEARKARLGKKEPSHPKQLCRKYQKMYFPKFVNALTRLVAFKRCPSIRNIYKCPFANYRKRAKVHGRRAKPSSKDFQKL